MTHLPVAVNPEVPAGVAAPVITKRPTAVAEEVAAIVAVPK
jgi:hypothetical protein